MSEFRNKRHGRRWRSGRAGSREPAPSAAHPGRGTRDWAAGKDQSLVVGFLRGNLGGRSARGPEEGVSNEVVYVFVEGLGEDVAEVG